MHKSLMGLIGAMGTLIAVVPAAYASPASLAPAVNTATSHAPLEPVALVIAPRAGHSYHRDYRRPVYHHDYHHYYHHNRGPAIIIR